MSEKLKDHEECKGAEQLEDLMNNFIQTATIIHRNLHILHWNIEGHGFLRIHKYFNNLYDDLMEDIDTVAEELRKNDIYPKVSIVDCLDGSSVKPIESGRGYDIEDALKIAIDEYEELLDKCDKMAKISSNCELWTINDIMVQFMHKYNKALWFLKVSK